MGMNEDIDPDTQLTHSRLPSARRALEEGGGVQRSSRRCARVSVYECEWLCAWVFVGMNGCVHVCVNGCAHGCAWVVNECVHGSVRG